MVEARGKKEMGSNTANAASLRAEEPKQWWEGRARHFKRLGF